MAAWIAVLAEMVRERKALNLALTPEERMLPDLRMPWPWECDAVSVAQAVVHDARNAAVQRLAEQLTA
jgi:hypothetical protein